MTQALKPLYKRRFFKPHKDGHDKSATDKQMNYIKVLAYRHRQDVSDLITQGLSIREAGAVINALLEMSQS